MIVLFSTIPMVDATIPGNLLAKIFAFPGPSFPVRRLLNGTFEADIGEMDIETLVAVGWVME